MSFEKYIKEASDKERIYKIMKKCERLHGKVYGAPLTPSDFIFLIDSGAKPQHKEDYNKALDSKSKGQSNSQWSYFIPPKEWTEDK